MTSVECIWRAETILGEAPAWCPKEQVVYWVDIEGTIHTLFTMSLVIVLVRARIAGMDRALIEASEDLYATPWRTFYQITLPQISPAILAGFLLSFTFSFDDFIVAFFVAGANTTLPIYVFASIRRGITPEVNAIGTMVLAVSLTLLIFVQVLLRRRDQR